MPGLILITLVLFFCNTIAAQDNLWYPYKNAEGQWSFISTDGQQLNNEFFDSIVPFDENNRYPTFVQRDGKWGYINAAGEYLIQLDYTFIEVNGGGHQRMGYLLVGKKNENGQFQYGMYTYQGKEILPAVFSELKILTNWNVPNDGNSGIATRLMDTSNNSGVGLYNFKGEQLLAHEYSSIQMMPLDQYSYTDDHCVYVFKRNEDGETIRGGFNLSQQNWIFPCKYLEEKFDDWHNVYSVFRNRTSLAPLVSEPYVVVLEGYSKSQYTYDYYKLNGEFMFNSQSFDVGPVGPYDQISYYVVGDSIIGKSNRNGVQRICDSLDRYILSFGTSDAIYDIHRGFLLDSMKYWLKAPDCKFGVISATDIESEHYLSLDFEGVAITWPANSRYVDGKFYLIVRDNQGQEIDMSPFRIISKASDEPEFDDLYIAALYDKFGVIDIQKNNILSFKYDYLYRNQGQYNILIAGKGKKIHLFDVENDFRKLVSTKQRIRSFSEGNDRFIAFEKKNSFSVYDTKTKQFILKHLPRPDQNTGDSIEYIGEEPYNSFSVDYLDYLDVYTKKNGWTFYDEHGDFIANSPIKSIYRMYPAILDNKFEGFIYPTGTIARYGNTYKTKLHLFNGLTFDSVEYVRYVSYNPIREQYWVYDIYDNIHIYSENEELLGRYQEINGAYDISRYPNGELFIVKSKDKFTFCDTNFVDVFHKTFDRISELNPLYLGYTDDSVQLINFNSELELSPAYNKIVRLGRMYLAEKDFNLFDIYTHSGEILIQNGTSIKKYRTYFVIQMDSIEYWITNLGEIYAKHSLTK